MIYYNKKHESNTKKHKKSSKIRSTTTTKTVELKNQHNPKEPSNINKKEIVTKLATRTSDYIREDEMNVHTSHTPMGRHAKPRTSRWKHKTYM
jgi:hypothetical protein